MLGDSHGEENNGDIKKRYVVPDYPPDSVMEFTETIEDAVESAEPVSFLLSRRSWFFWLPVGATTEALVAETIGQSLDAGLVIPEAIELTSRVTRCQRMVLALQQMEVHVHRGTKPHMALVRTQQRISTGLIETLRIGLERGTVSTELRAFARRFRPNVAQRLIRSVGRPSVTVRFAVNLARLLQTNRLNEELVIDAGRLSAPNDNRFTDIIQSVSASLQNGESLSQAVHHHPHYFDRLFCRFVECGSGRDALRRNLLMLAGEA